jgi:arabinogalactan endo-1,4-beta-galactosidase
MRKVKRVISLILAMVLMVLGVECKTQKVYAFSSISGVSQVTNMTSDFCRGVDISSVLALENSGVEYKYPDGTSGDIFDILSGAG